jgi:hypothetical protein
VKCGSILLFVFSFPFFSFLFSSLRFTSFIFSCFQNSSCIHSGRSFSIMFHRTSGCIK